MFSAFAAVRVSILGVEGVDASLACPDRNDDPRRRRRAS